MSTDNDFLTPILLEGTWLGISQQTVTVTDLRPDGTFSGTYFTPTADVRMTFVGEWFFEDDVLTLGYRECSASFLEVPMDDVNRVDVISADIVILHPEPSGDTVQWKRLHFAEREDVDPLPEVPAPSVEQLRQLSEDDLYNSDLIFDWIMSVIDRRPMTLWDDKVRDALQNHLPPKCARYFALTEFEGRLANGGMQHVMPVGEGLSYYSFMVGLAADAYEAYGCAARARVLRELVARSKGWDEAAAGLRQGDAEEDAWQSLYDEVSSYDAVFSKATDEDPDWIEGFVRDLKRNPEDFTAAEK